MAENQNKHNDIRPRKVSEMLSRKSKEERRQSLIAPRSEPQAQRKQSRSQFLCSIFTAEMQVKAAEFALNLSNEKINTLNQQHPAFVASHFMQEIFKQLIQLIEPCFNQCGNEGVVKMFSNYKQFIDKIVQKYFNERKQLTQNLNEAVYRENPQDGVERWKSHCYAKLIRELEENFYLKKQFREHAEKNFGYQSQKIRNFMSEKAKKVPEHTVKEKFVKIYLNKQKEIKKRFDQREGQERSLMIEMLREASRINRLREKRKQFKHRETVQMQFQKKKELCHTLNSWTGLFLTPYQYFLGK